MTIVRVPQRRDDGEAEAATLYVFYNTTGEEARFGRALPLDAVIVVKVLDERVRGEALCRIGGAMVV